MWKLSTLFRLICALCILFQISNVVNGCVKMCPPPKGAGACAEMCGTGCLYGQMCCSNGCGHSCMDPITDCSRY